MRFGRLDITFKDYLGRIGPGITAALSILYKNEVYEGMCWYTEEHFIIELPEEIENEIGKIEEYEEYDKIITYLKSMSADYVETAPKMKDLFEEEPKEEPNNAEDE